MKVLETILHLLTVLARVIFPRKPGTATDGCPCPSPYPTTPSPSPDLQPAPACPSLYPDTGDGSSGKLHRRDTVFGISQEQASTPHNNGHNNHLQADWLGISGYSLMLLGGMGCVYKWFIEG
ncbi:hypothetical protein ACGE0T_11745 [Parabacteroides sp. APC149_11_2_Y6]